MTLTRRKNWLASALDACGLPRVINALHGWDGLLVLNYHRIGRAEDTDLDRGVFSCTADEFRMQMDYVRKHHTVIGINDLETWFTERNPTRAVMITFDDGYVDNYEVAFPILAERGLQAVFFPATGFLDQRNLSWWDEIAWMIRHSSRAGMPESKWWPGLNWEKERETAIRTVLRAFKKASAEDSRQIVDVVAELTGVGRANGRVSAPWMTWDNLREMVANKMSVGAHTVTHPILSRLSPPEQFQEIHRSKQRLEEMLNRPVHAFSYPVGQSDSFDGSSRQLLDESGIRWAFSFYGGYTNGKFDPYDLQRIAIDSNLGLRAFRCITQVPQLFLNH